MPARLGYTTKNNDAFDDEKAKNPKKERFVNKRHDACVVLSLEEGHCCLTYKGEVTPDQIGIVFAMAKKAGHTSIGNGLLIDFTQFTGTIDWEYAQSGTPPAPGMASQPKKIAYVAFGEQVMIIKALMVWLSKKYDCKIFRHQTEAEAWLEWK
jgi:hypothetical protein